MQGQVAKAKSGRKLNAYLFNDLVLFTEDRGNSEIVYRYPFPLEETSVREKQGKLSTKVYAESSSDMTMTLAARQAFVVVHRGTSVAVKPATARQCLLWIRTINEARARYLEVLNKGKAGVN